MELDERRKIFRKRLNELKKEKGWSQVALAQKLNFSKDTVANWTKPTKQSFPNFDTIIKIADLFKVDVGYLLGEQDFKRASTQRIADLTNLSETAAEKLKKNALAASVLTEIINSGQFDKLIASTWNYTHSHYAKIKIDDSSDMELNEDMSRINSKDIIKFIASNTYSLILDELFEKNNELMKYSRDNKIIKDLFFYIEKNMELINDPKTRPFLLEYVRLNIDNLSSSSFDILKKASTEMILDNYSSLADVLGIDLEKKMQNKNDNTN